MATVGATDIDGIGIQSSGSSLDDVLSSDVENIQDVRSSENSLDEEIVQDYSSSEGSLDDGDVHDKVDSSNENNVLNASFNDLQSIIDSAHDDDVIELSKDYSIADGGKTITISRNLTIDGKGHTLNGNDGKTIFSITEDSKNIILKNITFCHGKTSGKGGAISNSHSSSSLEIYDCKFNDNYADDLGGAIYSKGYVYLMGCSFDNNYADNYGGAVYIDNEVKIRDTSFDGNRAIIEGGAVYSSGKTHILNSQFRDNKAFGSTLKKCNGGALRTLGECYIELGYFRSNYASSYGGAIYATEVLTLNDSHLLMNNAGSLASAIYTEAEITAVDSKFDHNDDSGLYLIYAKNAKCNIDSCVFDSNKVCPLVVEDDLRITGKTMFKNNYNDGAGGGAIYAVKNLYINWNSDEDALCEFYSNTGSEGCLGGAIYCEGNLYGRAMKFSQNYIPSSTKIRGGAIYCEGETHINSSDFSDNWVVIPATWIENVPCEGGAIWSKGKCYIDSCNFSDNQGGCCGGAICAYDDLKITGKSSFTNNSVYVSNLAVGICADPDGGAIYCKGNAEIDNAVFTINEAIVAGGAIFCEKECTVSNSKFINNSVNDLDAFVPGVEASYGGAIRSNGFLTIQNCSFEDNYAYTNGGAIYADNGVKVSGSSFIRNFAPVDGGAIYSKDKATLSNSTFYWNSASHVNYVIFDDSYGGAVRSNGTITVDNCSFYENFADQYGSAIYAYADLNIKNSNFTNHSTKESGGAIYCEGNAVIDNSIFSNNYVVELDGGAIFCEGYTTITNSVFANNSVMSYGILASYGGAIRSKKSIVIRNSAFEGNFAHNHGGAIYADSGINISNSNFTNNKANVDGGAIYSDAETHINNCKFEGNNATHGTDAKSFGGAVRSNGEITIETSTFNDNFAYHNGGAVYADKGIIIKQSFFTDNEAYLIDGGAVYSNDDTTISDSMFRGNSATGKSKDYRAYGGAVCSYGVVTLKKTNFYDNYAFNRGGAIFAFKEIRISDCSFTGNNASDYGGAIFTRTIKQKVTNSLFKNNKATSGDGGAIYVNNNCDPEFDSCTFEGDTASNMGGAIYMDSVYSYLKLNGCLFNKCSAKEGGAVYAHQLSSSITRCNFTNNKATSGDGGALYVKNNDPENYSIACEFVTCRFENNNAGNRGGAIFFGSKYSDLKVSYCTFVDNHADKKDYQGKKRRAGHSIFNMGYFKTIDMCWFGKNDPSFNEELVEYHTTGSDEDHVPTNYLRIYIKINDTDLYVGNPYKLTVYFNSTKGSLLSKDLMHSTGRFFGDGDFSNLYVDLNDMKSDVVLTKEKPTISAQLDHQVVTLKLDAKLKDQTEINIISCEDVVYPDDLKVTYEIIHGTGNEYYKVQDSNGRVLAEGKITDPSTLYVSKLSPGDYTLTMYSLETRTTLPCNVTKDFKVLKRPVSANVTVENVSYGNPSVIKIKADFDATYKVNVNGTTYDVVVNDGVGSKSINGLNAGDYYANVTLEEDNYILTPKNAVFTVNKADIDLVVVVFDELYNQDVEGIVYASVDGDYNLTVAGQSSVITVKSNLAYFNIGSGLEVGAYEANVSFAGNENYKPAFNKTIFEVHQDIPLFEIEATPDYFPYGQTAIISHKLPYDASGTIKYFLHDGTFLGELDVRDNLTLPILDMGFYGIIANYSGDHNYAHATDAVLILVDLAPNNAMVTVDNVTYGEESLIVVSADVDGVYQVDINGTVHNITVKNGVGSKSIALDAGVYYANVTFDSWNYDTSSKNAVFEIYKASTNMHVLAYDIIYSQDLEGIIYSDVDGKYNLSIGDFSISVIVKDGLGQFNAGIFNAGYYTVIASYLGDANHKSNSSSIDIHIAKYIPTISVDIPEIDYGDVGVINITCDVYGSVNVTVNGITETLDLNGQRIKILFASLLNALGSNYDASLDLYNLNAGTYPVTVTYNGDENYESPSVSGELKVNSVNASMDIDSNDISVGEVEIITVSLPSDANGNVTVTVDGKNYTAEVKDGKAVISIPNLSSGHKEVKISYSGDNNYNPAEDTVSFAVNKLKPNMTSKSNAPIKSVEKLHVVVKLPKDATGTVTVIVDGKKYSAKVKDGKAVFDISGLDPGKYNLKAQYSGDDKYYEDQIELSITVKDNGKGHENNTDDNGDNNTDNNPDHNAHNQKNRHSQGIDLSSKVTGNPILALILALMTIGFADIRRFKK